MLFSLGLKELQNFCRNFIIFRQGIEIRSGCCRKSVWIFSWLFDLTLCRLRIMEGRRLRRKCETISFLECRNVFEKFLPSIANLQQIGFK